MVRRPSLDGLRAVAVLAVMAFHTSPAAHGGFLGVDVFFVISGYLITALLLAEHQRSGRIALSRFYLRRALRLGPGLLVMLCLAIPLMLTVMSASMGIPVWAAVASTLLYVSNWANVVVNGGTGPITHTWSLAIEEQFYLIWPVILAIVLRRTARPPARTLLALTVVLAGARWISWDQTHGAWIYYATTSHSDGLLAGALLAIVLARQARTGSVPASAQGSAAEVQATVPRWSQGAAFAGLAGIALLMLTLRIDAGATYRYGLALIVLACLPVVHHLAIASSGPLVRVLSWRPLVFTGTISYGLYLFHFPIFEAVQKVQPGRYSHGVQHLLEFGLTVPVTLASWYLVERPALRLKDRLATSGPAPSSPSTVGPWTTRQEQPAPPM